MTFFFKKLVSRFFFPVPLVLELMLVGWLLRRRSRYKRFGLGLIWAGPVLLALMGYGLLGEGYLRRIESQYRPIGVDSSRMECAPAGTDIVVLGQGLANEPARPMLSRVNRILLARLLEGVRIHRRTSDSRIVVSVSGDSTREDEERFIREFAGVVGLTRDRFVLMSGSQDTAAEARNVRAVVRGTRVVLVSSASHLPRAVALFRREGLDPIPAPCDYETRLSKPPHRDPDELFPGVGGLAKAERAIYEALGRLWTAVGGR